MDNRKCILHIWRSGGMALLLVCSLGCRLSPVRYLMGNIFPQVCEVDCAGCGLPGPDGCRCFKDFHCNGFQTTTWGEMEYCGPGRVDTGAHPTAASPGATGAAEGDGAAAEERDGAEPEFAPPAKKEEDAAPIPPLLPEFETPPGLVPEQRFPVPPRDEPAPKPREDDRPPAGLEDLFPEHRQQTPKAKTAPPTEVPDLPPALPPAGQKEQPPDQRPAPKSTTEESAPPPGALPDLFPNGSDKKPLQKEKQPTPGEGSEELFPPGGTAEPAKARSAPPSLPDLFPEEKKQDKSPGAGGETENDGGSASRNPDHRYLRRASATANAASASPATVQFGAAGISTTPPQDVFRLRQDDPPEAIPAQNRARLSIGHSSSGKQR